MILLRPPRPETDAGPLTEAINLPGVRAGMLRLPFTPESLMRDRLGATGPNVHLIVADWDGHPVGQGTLFLGEGRRRHAGEVGLFVHDAYWGRGIGRALLEALLDLADNWYGLTRLGLEASPGNARALALYDSLGFEREGLKRLDTLTDGRLEDSVVMGRLRPAPSPGPAQAEDPA